MKVKVVGDVSEVNGAERALSDKCGVKIQKGEAPTSEEMSASRAVERFDKVMSSLADLVREGMMIEMKP